MKLILTILLAARVSVTATIYHAVPAQTDSTPFITASTELSIKIILLDIDGLQCQETRRVGLYLVHEYV